MKKYLVVIEETGTGYSAYSPHLEGCVSTGRTRDEVENNIREAIEFHLEGLRLEGMGSPDPHAYLTYVEVPPRRCPAWACLPPSPAVSR